MTIGGSSRKMNSLAGRLALGLAEACSVPVSMATVGPGWNC